MFAVCLAGAVMHLFFSCYILFYIIVSNLHSSDFVTQVYYQLENLSQADPPYKSIAALNCIILGCAKTWDVDRAYQTFNAIDSVFGLTPNIHSYNGLICAFGKLRKVNHGFFLFTYELLYILDQISITSIN